MSLKNKILSGVSTILVVGTVAGTGLNIKLPNTFYNKFDDGSIDSSVSEIADKNFLDPYGDRMYIERKDALNYFQSNKMVIDGNTIKIALDKNLPQVYVDGAIEAYELYKKVFEIINPNVKLEIGQFDYEDSNIYIKKVDEDKGQTLMTTSMMATGREYNDGATYWNRGDVVSTITVYNLSDSQSAKSTAFSFAHEYGHAIFGFDDYNKGYTFESYGYELGKQPLTTMNYFDLDSLETVSDTPKLTVLDMAMAVEQWGLFADNGIEGENPFKSEAEYYEYIDSRLSEVCYTDNQEMLADDLSSSYYGKTSIVDYIKLRVEREKESSDFDEPEK